MFEWKWKRDVTPIPSEMVRSFPQEEGVDPYHQGSMDEDRKVDF